MGESVREPRKYFCNNVVNTLHLLDAMMAAGVKVIVFSSSAATYGEPQTVPIPERLSPKPPTSPYGETKLYGTQRTLKWYGSAYHIGWVALRNLTPRALTRMANWAKRMISRPT